MDRSVTGSDRLESIDRRRFLLAASAATLAGPRALAEEAEALTTRPVGNVAGPTFYRHGLGNAPGRLHEPSFGPDKRLWTSPLDGTLWCYHVETGQTEIFDLETITGRSWSGLHLWPVAHGNSVLLCTPKLNELWVWNHKTNELTQHAYPHANPEVYGGFVVDGREHIYLYDTRHQSVLKWNPRTHVGENFPCPYSLTGTLYMTFVDHDRNEIWGSTYTGNDLVRFDIGADEWTGHFRCPLKNATPTAGGRVFDGNTLYVSDHLNGRIVPLNIETHHWGDPIPVPGYRDWYGYLSSGFLFRDLLYLVHSTWVGGDDSIDGEPHHFIGSLSVFDPRTHEFSRLDIPTRNDEQLKNLQADYCATRGDEFYILAVDRAAPHTALVLQSHPVGSVM